MLPEILFAFMLLFVAILTRPDVLPVGLATHSGRVFNLVFQRGIGFLLMAPALIIQIREFPFWLFLPQHSLWFAIGFGIVIPAIARYLASVDKNDAQAAGYTGLHFSKPVGTLYLCVTSAYMTGYEILMRGTLLYWLITRFSLPVAILVNTCIYALMHLIKNRREALMSIPLGIFLCILTVWTQSVWPAAFFHLAMALGFEITYSQKANDL